MTQVTLLFQLVHHVLVIIKGVFLAQLLCHSEFSRVSL